jgi:hypothetical protein
MQRQSIYEHLGNMTIQSDGTIELDYDIKSSTYVIPIGSKICLVQDGIDEFDILLNRLNNRANLSQDDMQRVDQCFFTTTYPMKIGINLLCKVIDLARSTKSYSYPEDTIFDAFFEGGRECFYGRVSKYGDYYFLSYDH